MNNSKSCWPDCYFLERSNRGYFLGSEKKLKAMSIWSVFHESLQKIRAWNYSWTCGIECRSGSKSKVRENFERLHRSHLLDYVKILPLKSILIRFATNETIKNNFRHYFGRKHLLRWCFERLFHIDERIDSRDESLIDHWLLWHSHIIFCFDLNNAVHCWVSIQHPSIMPNHQNNNDFRIFIAEREQTSRSPSYYCHGCWSKRELRVVLHSAVGDWGTLL